MCVCVCVCVCVYIYEHARHCVCVHVCVLSGMFETLETESERGCLCIRESFHTVH